MQHPNKAAAAWSKDHLAKKRSLDRKEDSMDSRIVKSWHHVVLVGLVSLLAGCASPLAYRTQLVDTGLASCPPDSAHLLSQCANITPETGPGYELHFVEFDDQGWPAAGLAADKRQPDGRPPSQVDHLMQRLDTLLGDEKRYLNVILYVHGWKHDARSDDGDVKRFRRILASARTLEAGDSRTPRKVVGIYVGWRGKSWNLPGPLINLSFWSRKAAALRVSHGSVQELFARLRSVQQFYNSTDSPDCALPREGRLTTGGCRVRTLMIGHSFGAWILYSAISGPLIATLNAERDLNGRLRSGSGAPGGQREEKLKAVANRRPADMIVLINPAFEAVRYDPLHQAALHYDSTVVQPPLLVTVTSTADQATKIWFRGGRFINSITERPVSSDAQSEAMTRTHGHIERYQTHALGMLPTEACPGWMPPGPLSSTDRNRMLENKKIEAENSARFFNAWTGADGLLKPGWKRDFCGRVRLSLLDESGPRQDRKPNSLVWNVRADPALVPNHTDIVEENFLEFVRQLYDDTEMKR
jgi:hypothetical protein